MIYILNSFSRSFLVFASPNASIDWKYNDLHSLASIFASDQANFLMLIH
jgi:hypothetical protein